MVQSLRIRNHTEWRQPKVLFQTSSTLPKLRLCVYPPSFLDFIFMHLYFLLVTITFAYIQSVSKEVQVSGHGRVQRTESTSTLLLFSNIRCDAHLLIIIGKVVANQSLATRGCAIADPLFTESVQIRMNMRRRRELVIYTSLFVTLQAFDMLVTGKVISEYGLAFLFEDDIEADVWLGSSNCECCEAETDDERNG